MELTIEKLVYGGDGLARLAEECGSGSLTRSGPIEDPPPHRGKAVFLPFVLEGERVEACLVEEKRGFARARVEQILQSSPQRIAAACPYFIRCGGCHYQHTTYEHQLAIKAAILKENLRRTAKLELPTELIIHASPPWNYRNRTRMRVQTSPEFALGYYKFASHELLAVEECPISSPLINRAIAAMWDAGRRGAVDPRVREIEFFANAEDTELLVEVYVGTSGSGQRQTLHSAQHGKREGKPTSDELVHAADSLRSAIPQATGVTIFPLEPHPAESKAESAALATSAAGNLQYKTARMNYRVSAGAFFQVNRFLIDTLIDIVMDGRSGRTALDLYAGVGLFASVLSREFERVIAVESSQPSSNDLAYNVPGNVKPVRAMVEKYLRSSTSKPDFVVVDPPRSGLGPNVARAIAEMGAPRLTYVSCDPATLARDLVVLLTAGYRVEQAHLVDLFPQTFHLETVLQLSR